MKRIVTALLTLPALFCQALHIGYLLPAGGKQGTEVELIVGGQQFWGLKSALISGTGVTVTGIEQVRGFPHPAGPQRKYLMNWLRAIRKGRTGQPPLPENTSGWMKHPYYDKLDKLEPLQMERLLRFLLVPRNPLQASPAIASTAIVKLRIAPDAEPGKREFRLVSNGRISNPLSFHVGVHGELRDPYFPLPPEKPGIPEFQAPAVLNGQIMPGETDFFLFRAEKGEILTFTMLGRALMPFIGDGVPGFFQPQMELFNEAKQRVAFVDDTYFNPDGSLEFKVLETGAYTLAIRDALFRGRDDFVYRITVEKGARPYEIAGPPEFPIPTVDAGSCGVLSRGVMIRGTLDKPGKQQFFHLDLEQGKPVVMEVFARQLGSPLDSLLRLYDAAGKLLALNDDFPRMKAGTIMQHTDSYLTFTPAVSGRYHLVLSDTTAHGGKDYAYYLRIDEPRPRFKVYTAPSALEVARNGSEPLKVVAERLDGYSGPIILHLQNGGPYSIAGTNRIPAGESESVITLQADRRKTGTAPRKVSLSASGENGCRTIAIPSDESMQAFAYTHLVPTERMFLTQRWKYSGGEKFAWTFKETTRRIKPGGSLEFSLRKFRLPENAKAELCVTSLPAWLKAAGTGEGGLTLLADPQSAGKAANLLFKVNYSYDRKDKKGTVKRERAEIFLPALTVESVP